MNTCLFSLSITTHEFVYSAHQIIHLLCFLHFLDELQRRSDHVKKEPQLLHVNYHLCNAKFEKQCDLDVDEEIRGWKLMKEETVYKKQSHYEATCPNK